MNEILLSFISQIKRFIRQGHRLFSGGNQLKTLELALWGVGVCAAVVFLVIKVRAWGPIDAPEQMDFATYYTAARVGLLSPADLYSPQRWQHVNGPNLGTDVPYLYFPSFAWILRPLALLPYEVARRIWFWGSVGASALVVICLLRMELRRDSRIWGIVLWLLLPSTLDTLYLGQVNDFLALLITVGAMSFYEFRSRIQFIGGTLVGIAGGVKLFPIILIVMGLWREKWRFSVGCIAGLAVFISLGLLGMPLSTWAEFGRIFMDTTTALSPPGLSILHNQSLFAFWRKLSFEGTIPLVLQGNVVGVLTVQPLISSTLANLFAYGSVLLVIAFTAVALWNLHHGSSESALVAWALLLITTLIVAPISWWHYLTIVAPLFPGLIEIRRHVPVGWRLLLPVGYLFVVLQRGIMLWLQAVPFLILSCALLVGIMLWWSVFIHYALGMRQEKIY